MVEYDIQRCTRRCHATGRELAPGEVVFSVLVEEGNDIARHDFSAEAWQGPPESAIGWWKGTIADPSARRMHWAPNDVMLHYFEQLEGNPAKEDARYVLALLLVRRRIVRVEATEQDPAGHETLVVFCPRNEVEYRVKAVMPSPDREAAIQQELSHLLQGNSSSPLAP
jgi:hypothetical protein